MGKGFRLGVLAWCLGTFSCAFAVVPDRSETLLWIAHEDFAFDEGRAQVLLRKALGIRNERTEVLKFQTRSYSEIEDALRERLVSLRMKPRSSLIFYISAHGENGIVIGGSRRSAGLAGTVDGQRFFSCDEIGQRLARLIRETDSFGVGIKIFLDQCFAKTCAWRVAEAFRKARQTEKRFRRFPRIVSASDYFEPARRDGFFQEFISVIGSSPGGYWLDRLHGLPTTGGNGPDTDGNWTDRDLVRGLSLSKTEDKLFFYPDTHALLAYRNPAQARRDRLERLHHWDTLIDILFEGPRIAAALGDIASLGAESREEIPLLSRMLTSASAQSRPALGLQVRIALSALYESPNPSLLKALVGTGNPSTTIFLPILESESGWAELSPLLSGTERTRFEGLRARFVRE